VSDPTNLYVTLINKEYDSEGRNAVVDVELDGFAPASGNVSVMYLTVADGNVEAMSGVTLGDESITNNAPWHGRWKALGQGTNGRFSVSVPAASAAIVKVKVGPR
jgi:hypothetical protein